MHFIICYSRVYSFSTRIESFANWSRLRPPRSLVLSRMSLTIWRLCARVSCSSLFELKASMICSFWTYGAIMWISRRSALSTAESRRIGSLPNMHLQSDSTALSRAVVLNMLEIMQGRKSRSLLQPCSGLLCKTNVTKPQCLDPRAPL